MRRNTKGKKISSLSLVNRNGWNVEYQVWDSFKKTNKTTKRKKKFKQVEKQQQKATIFFLPPFLSFSSSLLLTNRLFFFILFPPVFPLSPRFGIISAFLALAYFQILLFHLLGTAASTSHDPVELLLPCALVILWPMSPALPPPSPDTPVTWKCPNPLVDGEEKKKKGMQCDACLRPFPAFFPFHSSFCSLDWMGEGVGWGLGPMLQWCFDSFMLPSPTSVECLASYSPAEWPMGPFALRGGKCFIWLFHSWVDQSWEMYTNCCSFWELSERELISEVVMQYRLLSSSFSPWHPTPSHSTSVPAQGRVLYSGCLRIMQSLKQKIESAERR